MGGWDRHLGGNFIRLFQVSHLQAVSVRFGGKICCWVLFLTKINLQKKSSFFFLPTGFGSIIGMFEEENYFFLKNVIGAANIAAGNIFLWLSGSWIH